MSILVRGRLTSDQRSSFSGFRVIGTFEIPIADTHPATPGATVTDRRIASVAHDGAFRFDVPNAEERVGGVQITVTSEVGLGIAQLTPTEEEFANELEIDVGARTPPVVVTPSPDITLGAQVSYTGRVIDPTGLPAPAGLILVIWGVPPGGAPSATYPLDVSATSGDGYVTGMWPDDELDAAFVTVAGSDPVKIAVTADKRFPARFVAVLPTLPEAPATADEDCGCGGPPRAPEAGDLATDTATYAGDLGRCVDFTIPNRTLEEVAFQAVVRTTQPELQGTAPPRQPTVPVAVLNRLADLARFNAPQPPPHEARVIGVRTAALPATTSAHTSAITPAIRTNPAEVISRLAGDETAKLALDSAKRFLGNLPLDRPVAADAVTEVASAAIAERDFSERPLRLEPSVLAELTRESRTLTPFRLLEAEQASAVRRFRSTVSLIAAPNPARFKLGDAYQVDWDDLPLAYQATTIAHGHLLTFKQVWKADGYSLGDLLYSLPLAPGQQKLISVLDWERRDTDTRQAHRTETEALTADLQHDRDITDIVRTALSERMNGSSSADVEAVGGGIGGFIGPLVFGAAGGVSSASSTARQSSGREISGTALNRVRDRTLQAASAVRGQRATVVQTSRQGESVRAQTEVVGNYAHCHAMTVEYFEVLRHFQVRQELAHVQECLFVPFGITPFTHNKTLRWRVPLERSLLRRELRGGFDALERLSTNWADADSPIGRYADEVVRHLDGELAMQINLPRPADTKDGDYDAGAWAPWAGWLWDSPESIWHNYLGVVTENRRDRVWNRSIAPGIAQRVINRLTLALAFHEGTTTDDLVIDPTMVSTFAQDRSLLVSLRIDPASLPGWTRAQIGGVLINAIAPSSTNPALPPEARIRVDSATFRYRTDHLSRELIANRRVLNDLTATDGVEMRCPLDATEKRNPRERDRRIAEDLIDHLDEYIEHYHRAIWLRMDPNRRYLLLDGFQAPDAGSRSVASVVENRVIGVVGNSLVMPVMPGLKLDSTYEYAESTPEDLRHLYAGGTAPPMRISVPTKGLFAEAVLGRCNSCEAIDDSKFWRFEEEPIPDSPTSIQALSTDSRRRMPPNLTPDQFPDPLVRMQTVPEAPDPTGLAAAMKALGTAGIFKDITGLALNQANSAQALKTAISTAQGFASRAGALAQQRFLNKEVDRSLGRIKEARDKKLISHEEAQQLTESALRGAIGEVRPKEKPATEMPEVKRAMERVNTAARGGTVRVTRPEGNIEVSTGVAAGRPEIEVSIDPPIQPIKQKSNLVCWAASGAMMLAWRSRQSMTVETALDSLGGGWRALHDSNTPLSLAQLQGFTNAVGLVEEGPANYTPEGLARLLDAHGPLWVVSDDGIEGNMISHIRIVTGIRGDGTADGTTVILADSATGTIVTESFAEFDRRLAATDPVRLGAGISHF